jgi:hypothetical protein
MMDWLRINHAIIGIVIQALGLGFVSWQVQQASASYIRDQEKSQSEELFKEALILHRHKQDMNRLLLDKSDAATALKMPAQKDILGFTLVNDFQNLFVLRCSKLLGDSIWDQIEEVIYSQLKKGASLGDFWQQHSMAYPPPFIEYVNRLKLNESGPNKGKDSASCGDMNLVKKSSKETAK